MPCLTVYETAVRGGGIPLFGQAHLLWLAGGGAFTAFSLRSYRRADAAGRQLRLRALAAALLVDEGLKYAVVLLAGHANAAYLPLHLCSIAMFVCLAYALHPSPEAGEFLYAVCLPGAAAALLFPGWLALPADSLLSVHSFSYHILLLTFILLPLSASEIRPNARRLPGCALALLSMLPPVYAVNCACGTNFFFLSAPGDGNPLAVFESVLGNPGYLAALPLLCGAVWALLYLPLYGLRRRRIQKKRTAALDKRGDL